MKKKKDRCPLLAGGLGVLVFATANGGYFVASETGIDSGFAAV
jgi:hypothetical protein